ncbi:hypothetical protein [Streptomyces sp. NPDC047525]|uniref:hypothetical protein n=1 Tax=Streptomyces sp. NPDC047525 TaxID=3155264 RepID=UPI0033DDEB2F
MFNLLRRAKKAAAVTPIGEESKPCPETGLPYGEPGSTERLAWIFAMDDREDVRERTEDAMKRAAAHPVPNLIVSTIATPLTRPHLIRVCDFEATGDRRGGICVECDSHGELSALRNLAPGSYGCQPGIEPFASPAPLWQ